MAKQELSLKQQYQRLTQAKAQATRNGQPTPKLDKKIEKMKAMMGSTVITNPMRRSAAESRVIHGTGTYARKRTIGITTNAGNVRTI